MPRTVLVMDDFTIHHPHTPALPLSVLSWTRREQCFLHWNLEEVQYTGHGTRREFRPRSWSTARDAGGLFFQQSTVYNHSLLLV